MLEDTRAAESPAGMLALLRTSLALRTVYGVLKGDTVIAGTNIVSVMLPHERPDLRAYRRLSTLRRKAAAKMLPCATSRRMNHPPRLPQNLPTQS
jgi:hypothetical protein